MIKTKTLFILGAGASNPFGYPTSIKLRDNILRRTQDSVIVNTLNYEGDPPDGFIKKLEEFVNEFAKSSVYSIDSFLEYRTEFMEIGKICIAAELINYEQDIKLRMYEKNWYMYLYDRLKTSFEKFNDNNISFITFNYDRSLEQFLFEAIRSRFGKNKDECIKIMHNIPIVHLYGQLDLLLWQSKDGSEYSSKNHLIKRLRKAPDNIKLNTSERNITESKEFQEAYNLIKRAEHIYFLGFSFDETNLERLNINLMKNKSIKATIMGIDPSKQKWIIKYFQDKIQQTINLYDTDALSLLQKHLEIE